jgi:hypothetical protein
MTPRIDQRETSQASLAGLAPCDACCDDGARKGQGSAGARQRRRSLAPSRTMGRVDEGMNEGTQPGWVDPRLHPKPPAAPPRANAPQMVAVGFRLDKRQGDPTNIPALRAAAGRYPKALTTTS